MEISKEKRPVSVIFISLFYFVSALILIVYSLLYFQYRKSISFDNPVRDIFSINLLIDLLLYPIENGVYPHFFGFLLIFSFFVLIFSVSFLMLHKWAKYVIEFLSWLGLLISICGIIFGLFLLSPGVRGVGNGAAGTVGGILVMTVSFPATLFTVIVILLRKKAIKEAFTKTN